ncbi:MAG: ABC transporter substrate-binding protein [Pseudomonadota bacterium]
MVKKIIKKATLIAFAWFCLGSNAWGQDKLTILLDWFVNPSHGPIIIAQQQGYFSANDLKVEIIAPADPSLPPKMVASGQADLALSYQPQLHLQLHEGLPLIRVGTLIATPLNCLLVLKEGPIQTIGDLKGRKIGFSVAGVDEAVLKQILARHRLALNDVELINVNFSLSPALMSKQVDAVIGAFRNFELNQMAIEDVEGRCFYLEEEGVPPYDELIYVAHPQKMDRAKIARFLEASEQAVQFIVNHPQESWEIFSNYSSELKNTLNERAWFDSINRFALRPSASDAGRYQRFEEFLRDENLIEGINPASQMTIDVNMR